MASIVKRNNRYCVVYTYKHTNGTLMKSLLLVLFRGLCSLLRLTAQQKIN